MSMVFCQGCGKQIHETAPTCPHCGAPQRGAGAQATSTASDGVSFTQAISICLSKYATFSGRARRSEYWYFYLFFILAGFAGGILDGVSGSHFGTAIVYIGLLIPSFAAATRRLHDTGRSGWWQLLYLTIIGGIFVLVWLASEGNREENQYGHPV